MVALLEKKAPAMGKREQEQERDSNNICSEGESNEKTAANCVLSQIPGAICYVDGRPPMLNLSEVNTNEQFNYRLVAVKIPPAMGETELTACSARAALVNDYIYAEKTQDGGEIDVLAITFETFREIVTAAQRAGVLTQDGGQLTLPLTTYEGHTIKAAILGEIALSLDAIKQRCTNRTELEMRLDNSEYFDAKIKGMAIDALPKVKEPAKSAPEPAPSAPDNIYAAGDGSYGRYDLPDVQTATNRFLEAIHRTIGGVKPWPTKYLEYVSKLSLGTIPEPITYCQGLFCMANAIIQNRYVGKDEKNLPQDKTPEEMLRTRLCLAGDPSTQFNAIVVAPSGAGKDVGWKVGRELLRRMGKIEGTDMTSPEDMIEQWAKNGNNDLYIKIDEMEEAMNRKAGNYKNRVLGEAIRAWGVGWGQTSTKKSGKREARFYWPCILGSVQPGIVARHLSTSDIAKGLARRFFFAHGWYGDNPPTLDDKNRWNWRNEPELEALSNELRTLAGTGDGQRLIVIGDRHQTIHRAKWATAKDRGDVARTYCGTIYLQYLPKIVYLLCPNVDDLSDMGNDAVREAWEVAEAVCDYSFAIAVATCEIAGAFDEKAAKAQADKQALWDAIRNAVASYDNWRASKDKPKLRKIPWSVFQQKAKALFNRLDKWKVKNHLLNDLADDGLIEPDESGDWSIIALTGQGGY